MKNRIALGLALSLPAFSAAAVPTVEVHGLLETDAFMANDYAGGSTTDIILSTMSLTFDATVNSVVDGHVTFLFEEDATDPTAIDEGYLNIAMGRGGQLTAGRIHVPFGSFESGMLSFPLTLQMADAIETVVAFGSDNRGLTSTIYAFNPTAAEMGATNDDSLSYGVSLGLAQEGRFSVGVGYISNFGESLLLQGLDGGGLGTPGMTASAVPGVDAHFKWSAGTFTLLGEYMAAQDNFVAGDFNGLLTAPAKPSVSNLEVIFEGGRGTTLALSYQTTAEAAFTGLPETAMGITIRAPVMKGGSVGLEYMSMDDYALVDGGTGQSADLTTLRFSVEF